jgi:hypothetical protein
VLAKEEKNMGNNGSGEEEGGIKGVDLVGTDQRDAKTGPVSRSQFRARNENGPRFDMG